MWCKNCNIVMAITGTTYEMNKNKDGQYKHVHRRFCKCPKCNAKSYNNSPNFQEKLKNEVKKKQKK